MSESANCMKFKTKGFILTETDKPSADKFPWSDSPIPVVHFSFDFIPGENVFIILVFSLLSFCSCLYVLLVSSLLYVSCTETKGRYLFDKGGIFFGQRTFCLWRTVYTGGEFSGVKTDVLKMHTSTHDTDINVALTPTLPLITQT